MKALSRYFLFILLAGTINTGWAQNADSVWNSKKAAKWFNCKCWRKGLTIKPHNSVNKQEFARQYHKNKAVWDKAFTFIKEHNLNDLAPGKYPIDSTLTYAVVTENPSKEFSNTAFESHRKYIDLQYIIRGKEKIGVAPVSSATVTKPYDEHKDSANYTADGKYYIADPVAFFFFPGDAHRPSIKVDGFDTVKKLVIKIPYAG